MAIDSSSDARSRATAQSSRERLRRRSRRSRATDAPTGSGTALARSTALPPMQVAPASARASPRIRQTQGAATASPRRAGAGGFADLGFEMDEAQVLARWAEASVPAWQSSRQRHAGGHERTSSFASASPTTSRRLPSHAEAVADRPLCMGSSRFGRSEWTLRICRRHTTTNARSRILPPAIPRKARSGADGR
jgi:hypothetical protein